MASNDTTPAPVHSSPCNSGHCQRAFTVRPSRGFDALHPRSCEKSPDIPSMLNDDRTPYRWQDHVITPGRAATNLMATLVVLVVGAALTLACTGATDPPHPPPAHVAVSERTPPLSQLAKRPALPRTAPDLL